MTVQEALKQLTELEKTRHAYEHAIGLIYCDAVTAAPEDSGRGRGETLGTLSGLSYEVFANPQVGGLLAFLREHSGELTPLQNRQVEMLNREYERISKVPQAEYVQYAQLLNEADTVWHRAKRDNDFPSFAPCLKQIVETQRRFAGYFDPARDPYDVSLDEYERGLEQAQLDRFFSALREKLAPLVHRIQAEGAPVDDSFLHQEFPIAQQRALSDYLMELMTIDRSHCSIGETEHPFTTNFNKYDVRITTKYHLDDMTNSLFSVVHEGGHALYELHTGDELMNTCLAGGATMGIHESQSRLFENMIGRSEAFVERIFPKLLELFPEQLKGVTPRQFYRAINKCEPSLIRIEADELTYPLHIMVRYDIEKLLFAGEISIDELPRIWAEKMKEYLGVEVPDDRRGVLQDSHWSGGSLGYFPSYAIGSAYAAQIVDAMSRDLDVPALVREGNLAPIVEWLTQRIYQYGKAKDPDELLRIATGKSFDPTYYTDYLTRKYSAIYNLK